MREGSGGETTTDESGTDAIGGSDFANEGRGALEEDQDEQSDTNSTLSSGNTEGGGSF